ncbi:MAG TPA: hypothetical protein VFD41_05585 [Actinomycetales bacterium]|nr:hypothetical protein [Actinomycetales bacterium]
MIRSIFAQPLLALGSALVVVATLGAGYAATTQSADADPASVTEQPMTDAELAAVDYSIARDQGRRLTAQAEVAQTKADQAAHAEYLVWLEEEKALKAAEAERLAAEEAAQAAEDARAAEAEAASRDAARDPRSAARVMLADHGWSSGQFDCLDSLWQKESGWDHTAANPSSGAYGIPQALPGSKMSSAGSDWETNPLTQIEWGLGYIADVYGSPCGAWSHSQGSGWY